MREWTLSETIFLRECFVLRRRIVHWTAELFLEESKDGSLEPSVIISQLRMLHARTDCTLNSLTFSFRYERMAAWEPS